ncbi:MAG: pesticidal protein Cry7Aa [Candidatus Kapaibacterium sp.]
MITVKKLGILLQKTDNFFENEGVLNPAVIKKGNFIHLFYRALAKDNRSTIGYCVLSSPLVIEKRNNIPILFPEYDYELQGVEDPRIVEIDDTFYLSYTAYNGRNALGALATSHDLIHWKKHGVIVPQITYEEFLTFTQLEKDVYKKYSLFNSYRTDKTGSNYIWDKNLIFFPRKINNKFFFLHRIKPDIQIVVSIESLEEITHQFWQSYLTHFDEYIVLSPRYNHESSYIGSGCPPIETPDGWLIIYHGVHESADGYVYSACAALLDLANPQIEIARLPYPLFYPEEDWELKGEVNNVCFPTGTIIEDTNLYIYYGAADERIAVALVSLNELMNEINLHRIIS